jgi:DNA/RNA-binding domain of Phe-tRNA-synthetase-like protein
VRLLAVADDVQAAFPGLSIVGVHAEGLDNRGRWPDVEEPHQGEVIYADAGGVLTRHWNHRDADRTKITTESRRVLAVLEAVEIAHHATVDAAADALAALLAARAKAVTVLRLAG